MKRFRGLPEYIHNEIKNVNITMIGGIGAGKSSYLNTVVTALNNKEDIVRDYKVSPSRTGKSKTRTVRKFTFRVT